MNLQNKTILITGGSAGIGLKFTELLHQQNNRIFICGRNLQVLENVAVMYSNVVPIQCDLANADEVESMVKRLQHEAPDLALVINNAGIQNNYSFVGLNPNDLQQNVDAELDINLRAPIILSTALLPLLTNQPEATIINISSGLALAPKKSAAVYSATKAALRTFSKALRYQLEDEAPHVNVLDAILPMVDTAMTSGRGNARMKLSPEQVVTEVLKGVRLNKKEVRVGGVKVFMLLHQVLPKVAENILRNS